MSSSIIFVRLKSSCFFLIKLSAFARTVNVFKPKKSNLTSPAFSTNFILNCVAGISSSFNLYKGTNSFKGLSPITKPAACVETCLFNPSRSIAVDKSSFT